MRRRRDDERERREHGRADAAPGEPGQPPLEQPRPRSRPAPRGSIAQKASSATSRKPAAKTGVNSVEPAALGDEQDGVPAAEHGQASRAHRPAPSSEPGEQSTTASAAEPGASHGRSMSCAAGTPRAAAPPQPTARPLGAHALA